MLNVYLLRHGETAWNADHNRYCGRTDMPLNDKGKNQALSVAAVLKPLEFTAIYASPLQRAYQTALIAGNRQQVQTDDRLVEADFGQWEGKTREEFIAADPECWEQWNSNPLQTKAGRSGETAGQVIKRVNDFFDQALQKHHNGNLLVVAHNTVNRLYLVHKLGVPVKDYRRLFLENCSITVFRLDASASLTLVKLNCNCL
jgi:alpha-ribazole phosphatase/probable phosphoglycerate mutase